MSVEHVESRPLQERADTEGLLEELTAIRAEMVSETSVPTALLDSVHPNYRDSARNLLHYLALRRHDLRPLQLRLARLGLSSLGRSESQVLFTLDAVLEILHRLTQRPWQAPAQRDGAIDFAGGERLLAEHTRALLGPAAQGRGVRVMVTMPSEAAREYTLVRDLVQHGMDTMRINCAHDDPATWERMIENLRRAERALNRSCRIVMDLAGPKLRTGPIEPGPAVARIRPAAMSTGGWPPPRASGSRRKSAPPRHLLPPMPLSRFPLRGCHGSACGRRFNSRTPAARAGLSPSST